MDVLFMIADGVLTNGQIIYTLVAEPVLMTAKECLLMAKEINNNPDVAQVAFCFPQIVPIDPSLSI